MKNTHTSRSALTLKTNPYLLVPRLQSHAKSASNFICYQLIVRIDFKVFDKFKGLLYVHKVFCRKNQVSFFVCYCFVVTN